jgi:GNAT superfamily N-acetyltransferase
MDIIMGNVELLPQYATIPITFEVRSVLQPELVNDGLGGIALHEQPVHPPYVKDYDVHESPLQWPEMFDLTNWAVLLAVRGGSPVAGATIAYRTPNVHMLADRDDLAVLWDIRVLPPVRGIGIGKRLFTEVVTWARKHACRQLKIETQNVNVPACRFYQHCGCTLGEINRYAYAAIPDEAHEVMLVWYIDL